MGPLTTGQQCLKMDRSAEALQKSKQSLCPPVVPMVGGLALALTVEFEVVGQPDHFRKRFAQSTPGVSSDGIDVASWGLSLAASRELEVGNSWHYLRIALLVSGGFRRFLNVSGGFRRFPEVSGGFRRFPEVLQMERNVLHALTQVGQSNMKRLRPTRRPHDTVYASTRQP